MRARNIKPAFFKNETLAEIEPYARLLFIGLWCDADRDGRLEYRPKRIRAEIFPYECIEIEKLLETLIKNKFIVLYECNNTQYLEIINFKKHQNPHKNEAPSIIPAIGDTSTVQIPCKNGSSKVIDGSARADSLIPDSLKEDSLKEESQQNKFSDDSQPMILTKYLFEKIRKNNEKAKTPNLQNWCNDIDKILRIDGYTEQQITKVIDFSQNDKFWKSNILSANSLRDKMGKLIIQSGATVKTSSKFHPEIQKKQLEYYQAKGLVLLDQNKADCITVFWDEKSERYKYRLDEPMTPIDYATAKERDLIMIGGPVDESS